jgi:histidine phosphotransferase ChpT
MPPRQDAAALGLRMAELMATRLCHDLSGPVGGLAAALGEIPADKDALRVAEQATATLRQRLALLRGAWGAMAGPLAGSALRDLARGLPNGHKLHIDLQDGLAAATLSPEAARLALNMLLLAAESLPAGGTVTFAGSPAGQLRVAIEGPRAGWPEGLAGMLAEPDAAWRSVGQAVGTAAARRMQAGLIALLVHAARLPAHLQPGASASAVPALVLDFGEARPGAL